MKASGGACCCSCVSSCSPAAFPRGELGGADRNAGSLLLRLMNEHSENTYLGNIFSIRNEIFSQADRFFYAFVKGPAWMWSWLAAGAVCLTAVHWILRKAGALHIPADGNRAGRWRTGLVLMGTGLLLRLLFEWLKDPLLHAGFALLLGTAAFLLAVSDTPLTLARLQGKK